MVPSTDSWNSVASAEGAPVTTRPIDRPNATTRDCLVLVVVLALLVGLSPVGPGLTRAAASEPLLTTTLPLDTAVPQTDISGLGGQQYRNNNQRNFWWNDRAGRWDGLLPTASPPAISSSRWWFWHDLGGTPQPIAQSENSSSRTPDAYWNEDTQTLYVFYSRGNDGTSRFRRYRYDATSDRYIETSRSGGVSAPTMLRGGSRVTIIRSPNGHLWAGVNYENQILISRSTDEGDTWPDPVAIKTTAIAGEGHWVPLVVDGVHRVAFAATEDGAAPGGEAKVHFLHIDQNASDWTSPAAWTDETGQLPPWEGDERADDELSAVSFEDRAFIVIETEPLGDARSGERPQLVVFERSAAGQWTKHVVLRYTSKFANDAKRPVITVDASNRLLVVTAGSTQRTHADMWYAPIDSLVGRDTNWSHLRIFEVSDPSTQDIYNTRLALPRFPVSSQSDLLTMIDDRGDAKLLWRQVVRASGTTQPPPPGNRAPVVDSVSIEPSSPMTNDTLHADVSASDPDGDALTYTYRWFKNGVVLSGRIGSSLDLSLPGNGDKGDALAVEVTASDGSLTSEPRLSAGVTVVNSPPSFDQELRDRTDREGAGIDLSAAASDPDGDVLTYSATSLPAGISIHSGTGAISGTIAPGTAGSYDVSVTVTDDEAETVARFTWTVTTEQPPPAPGGLRSESTSTEVVLTWDESSGATGYRIHRAAGGGAASVIGTTAETSFTDATAPPGTSQYWVTAVNAAGASSPSPSVTVADRIVLRSTSTNTARNSNSIAVGRPAGAAAGDVLIATVTASGGDAITAPAGWTPVRFDRNGTSLRQAIFWKGVGASNEPTAYSFGLSRNSSVAAVISAYRGVDRSNPIDIHGGRPNASSGSITAPSVTTTAANPLLLGYFGVTSTASNGITPPEQMIERADVTQGQGNPKVILEAADQVLPSAGATGPRVASVDRAGLNIGQLVALRPAAS
jgi:hypothetical protein